MTVADGQKRSVWKQLGGEKGYFILIEYKLSLKNIWGAKVNDLQEIEGEVRKKNRGLENS